MPHHTPAPPQGACRLHELGVIRAQGPEAAKFLHGQLTQAVESMPADAARLAGYCSAKGRLLATLLMWRRNDEEILLACSADLLAATLKRLSMFVLRAKCKLSDASNDIALWGLAGASTARAAGVPGDLGVGARHAAPGGTDTLRLPDALVDGQWVQRYLSAVAAGQALPIEAVMSEAQWRWLEVHSGVVRVVHATVEQFVPQMVNLELVGGVNFQKGCYPGQEVVARSQYRGTTKRRAYVMQARQSMQAGQEVFSSEDPAQPCGLVALAGEHAGSHAALVELKMAALESGSLHLGAADGPGLVAMALPYALPSAEA